jgi:acetyl/propionyl-CoA carboxylase alpha subunit
MLTIDLESGAHRERLQVALVRRAGGGQLLVNGHWLDIAAAPPLRDCIDLTVEGVRHRVHVVQRGDVAHVHVGGRAWRITLHDPVKDASKASAQADQCSAPMPGTVIAVHVKPGDRVTSGQPLVVIESMKMQMNLDAERDGTVAEVCCAVGDSFEREATLVRLEPAKE